LLREAGGRDDGVKKEGSWAEAGGIKEEEEEAGTRMDRGANGGVMLKRRSEWNGRRLVRAVWWRRVGGRRGPEEVEEAERERLGGGEGKMDGRREEDDDAGQLRADAERGKGNGMRKLLLHFDLQGLYLYYVITRKCLICSKQNFWIFWRRWNAGSVRVY
jgi:hypothetical protein